MTKLTQTAIKAMNVYEKLNWVRSEFIALNVKKSGINPRLEFEYYTLSDLVPPTLNLCIDIGLSHSTRIDENVAEMIITNIHKPEETIVFSSPFVISDGITNRQGIKVTNTIQDVGSSISYLRRYLYMLFLDVVETDDAIDKSAGGNVEVKSKRPATTTERQEIKKELTGGNAPKAMVNNLTKILKEVAKLDADFKVRIKEMSDATNKFETVSKEDCEAWIIEASERKAEIESA